MGITPPPALLQAVPIIVPPPSQPNTENTPLTRPARIVGGGAGLLPPPLVSINQGSQAHLAASQMASIMASQSQATPPATGPGAPGMPAGMFMGNTMMPIPEHLATKILSLQYIDMSELRPEAWLFEDEPAEKSLASLFKRRKEPITDILVWVQCFASYVAVLVQKYPQCTPHMMAYLATIVRCQRRFEGMGWVLYDTAYRRRAAKQKDLNWSAIDSSLFNTLFTGRAKTSAKCTHCLSEDHGANYCPMANGPLTQLTRDISLSIAGTSSKRSFSPYDAAVPPAKRGNFSGSGVRFGSTDPQYCGLFNARSGPRCTYGTKCKYMHVCANCSQNHP